MSFNNFMFTSKDRNVSLDFARHALPNSDMVGILFAMNIDPTVSTTSFASIAGVSYYQNEEDEVLFSMNTIFRIGEIKPMDEHPCLFHVNLTIIGDNDNDLRMVTDRIPKETFPREKGWQRLVLILNKMGQSTKAQEVFEVLLEQTTDDDENARICEQLGLTKYDQEKYQEALGFYEKCLQIRQKSLPSNHPDLARSCYNIGLVYVPMCNYSKAYSFYEPAVDIGQRSLPADHAHLRLYKES